MTRFLLRVITFLTIAFNKISGFSKQYAEPTIDFLEKLKKLSENDSLEEYVKRTKWQWDDKILEAVQSNLSRAIKSLKLVEAIHNNFSHPKTLEVFMQWLKTQEKPVQEALLHKIGSIAINNLSGDEYPMRTADADLIAQLVYVKKFQKEKNA